MRAGLLSALSGLLLWAAAPQAADADVLVAIDKNAQRMAVAVDGAPRYSWPVSTGVAAHDTPAGSYRPFRMERTHFSKEWDDAPMPFALFFTTQGHAIHGTNHVRSLGRAASHGCVRLSVRNAATLFNLVRSQGMGRTRVAIEGEGLSMAERGTRAVRRRGLDAYETDDVMSGDAQMGRTALPAADRPDRRPTRRPASAPGYGDPADIDGIDGW